MDAQKKVREAHKSVDILVSDSTKLYESTEFVGYDSSKLSNFEVNFKERIVLGEDSYLVFDKHHFTRKWWADGRSGYGFYQRSKYSGD